MKKILAFLLAGCLALSLTACGQEPADQTDPAEETVYPACFDGMEDLIAAARAEGLSVYLSSAYRDYNNQAYLFIRKVEQYGNEEEAAAIVARPGTSEHQIGITVTYQRTAAGADVWFGGSAETCRAAAEAGQLMAYSAANAVHLTDSAYRDDDGYWYGIRRSVLGFIVDSSMLRRMEIDAPADWADLLELPYQELIWTSNYAADGAGRLLLRAAMQQPEAFGGRDYLVSLDENMALYTASDAEMVRCLGTGECVIGIGFLHDGITQIVDNGYGNIQLVIPSSGTSFEIGATAIFKGAAHPNAAKLWIEYALSPDCVELAQDNGSYQFLVIDNAKQPEVAEEFGLDPENVMDYDFEDAKTNIKTYIAEVMDALGGGDDRFKTE